MNETEFQDGKPETPFVLSFMFFRYICPVIVNPPKYGFVYELDPEVSASLVSVSKLLNDLSLNNHDKYDNITGQWIQSHFQKLCDFMTILLDDNEIQKAKMIIEASVNAPLFTIEEKISESRNLKKLLDELNPQRDSTDSSSSSSLQKTIEIEELIGSFLDKFNNSNWKLRKELSKYKVKNLSFFQTVEF